MQAQTKKSIIRSDQSVEILIGQITESVLWRYRPRNMFCCITVVTAHEESPANERLQLIFLLPIPDFSIMAKPLVVLHLRFLDG